jgi:hypothetical protein
MKMGVQGFFVFWCMVAVAVLAACRLVRSPDRQAVIVGVLTVTAIAAYLIQGTYDYGLFWFRIAILMGVLFGLVQNLDQTPSRPTPAESTSALPVVSVRSRAWNRRRPHRPSPFPHPAPNQRRLRR